MSKFIVFALVIATICLILVNAAPAPDSQILDAKTAISKIIGKLINGLSDINCILINLICNAAAYNRIPGRSIVHPWEVATVIDPNTFVVHY